MLPMSATETLDEHYVAAFRYAKKRLCRSDDTVREIVHRAIDKLLTTHRHDPEKGPLGTWVIILVCNEANAFFRAETAGPEAVETRAQYRNHDREGLHVASTPPDEVLIEREEQPKRAARIAHLWDLLPRLLERLADHPIASGMISEWLMNAEEDLTPRQLAARLGVSNRQVYKAKELIEYHAKKIREGAAA